MVEEFSCLLRYIMRKAQEEEKNERWKEDIIVGWIFTGREMCRQISGGLNVSDVLLVIRRANEITIIFSFFLRDFFVLFALWMGFPLLLVAATFMNVVVLVRRRRAKECKFCNDLQVYFFARSWLAVDKYEKRWYKNFQQETHKLSNWELFAAHELMLAPVTATAIIIN